MAVTRRRASSAEDLKALGHPLRLRLLELLSQRGPMTATEAGAVLAQTPANMSWHLRRLAEQGFVRQTKQGPGRRRPWKAVAESWSDADTVDPASQVHLEREIQVLRTAMAAEQNDDRGTSVKLDRRRMWLTSEEVTALSRDLEAVLSSYADRGLDSSARDDQRHPVAVVSWLAPLRESTPP